VNEFIHTIVSESAAKLGANERWQFLYVTHRSSERD